LLTRTAAHPVAAYQTPHIPPPRGARQPQHNTIIQYAICNKLNRARASRAVGARQANRGGIDGTGREEQEQEQEQLVYRYIYSGGSAVHRVLHYR